MEVSVMNRILVVEDSVGIAKQLTLSLELDGFSVKHAADLASARKLLPGFDPALLVLDVNLPDGNGFEFCEELRRGGSQVPVLFLTARQDEESVVKGFASGGCDFLRKPYGVQELLARIRNLLSRPIHRFQQVSHLELTLDLVGKRARYGEGALDISGREYEILAMLVKAKGEIVTREQMLSIVDSEGEILDRSLDSHVSRLRSKLKKCSQGKLHIHAEYGLGYRLGE
jgi:two-component system, OmpR family, response regulator